MDKADYLDKIENLLNDTQKFEKIDLKKDGILNFAINQEKHVEKHFKETCNSVFEETRRSLKSVDTKPGIMYGLCKVHKDTTDNCLLFDLFCQQLILLPIN